MAIIKKIINALKKTRDAFRRAIDEIFGRIELNDDFFEELEEILVINDVGIQTSVEIIDELKQEIRIKKITKPNEAKQLLKEILIKILKENADEKDKINSAIEIKYPCVITIVGVNGVGKTTTIGKLAHYFKNLNKDVSLVAGDTFRAAASEQLAEWASRNKVKIIKHAEGADAAAVVFDGISSAKAKKTDVLIVDTAGRLHTKTNLMQELEKINRIITREYIDANKYCFIVLDATIGQNALSQIKIFNEYIKIDGVILTKLDGTAKGGVIFAIVRQYKTPVVFVGVGEKIDDLEPFDPETFVNNLF
ncbi:MAG: signal recognition particle-docking protein FtsY [Clostridia bacterium]|nr:signal recognition particle-docking protein FtsY [Clostridia bacterium]MDD3231769.1 signal recognition particle-docking protein FtsY [Clostridia bacterium]